MRRVGLLFLLAMALAIPGPARASIQTIQVANFQFSPQTQSATSGDQISWSWTSGTHTVTAYVGAGFDSGSHTAPFTYQQTYGGGTILYRCLFHSSLDPGGQCSGMCGEIAPLDTVAPEPPSFSQPSNGASLSSGTVLFSGGAPADAKTVKLAENGATIANATVANVSWSVTVPLAAGAHTVVATSLDQSGNQSAPVSVSFSITDRTPPSPPVITTPSAGHEGRFFGVNVSGNASNDTTAVRVYEGDRLLASTSAQGGSWGVNITFAEGRHDIAATALDAAGNESTHSPVVAFVVDVTPPDVSIASPQTPTAAFAPLGVSGTASDNFEVANLVVTLTDALTGTQWNFDADCPRCGTSSSPWSANANVGPGVYTLTARATDGAGNQRTVSGGTLVVI